MNYCPCCSGLLLEHLRGRETYWFCRRCWQEMPVYEQNQVSSFAETVMGKLPNKLQKAEHTNTFGYARQRRSISGWIGLQELPA
ncbi:MAG: hypothetical protein RMY62_032355 [Nostoc sp. ZfuVER08]|uniref:Cysteine-rich CPCC domain-containing protein n=1 Tax=Nostoc punctiforme FACHB-252 TaxID=1357509 RepID=A0ABR8HJG3_NOSPU|nr:hypothetical protein [Nostoc punctiforme]MBD2615374.1 hypothetical protein [Nostoc punctiforme FACHB-252]MBL1202905.1 hypothetical protein [Nostoc sp. GBBB01]MDZ8014270.1 hypothetical protein [Nostoc sp. ZfuVER08]